MGTTTLMRGIGGTRLYGQARSAPAQRLREAPHPAPVAHRDPPGEPRLQRGGRRLGLAAAALAPDAAGGVQARVRERLRLGVEGVEGRPRLVEGRQELLGLLRLAGQRLYALPDVLG